MELTLLSFKIDASKSEICILSLLKRLHSQQKAHILYNYFAALHFILKVQCLVKKATRKAFIVRFV